jgi:hypothetical protein
MTAVGPVGVVGDADQCAEPAGVTERRAGQVDRQDRGLRAMAA